MMVSDPDVRPRATLVAMNLLNALRQKDHGKIAVACAYLGRRLPHVTEVHARDQDDRIQIEFVEAH